jgi:hypothetical protein
MYSGPLQEIFSSALDASFAAYRIGCALRAAWPDLALVEESDGTFDLDGFAGAGHCTHTAVDGPHLDVHTRYSAPFLVEPDVASAWTAPYVARAARKRGDGSLSRTTANGVYKVHWEGHEFVVAVARWAEGTCNHFHFWVLARERQAAELHAAIRASSLDDLVMPAALRREIVDDFTTFVSAHDDYARLGVPWKRGVLFLGPPGNGKTHCLRGVLGMLDLPTLYVQSLRAHYSTDERNIDEIFDRARRIAPCVIVFEDLDAQITPRNRSFFLNQLDGFAANAGLLVLATTNHPERLDPAVVERPSRFDRKYHFPLPVAEDRSIFLGRWTERLDPHLRLGADQHAKLVEETGGFSFAYLKELCLSAVLRWMKHRPAEGLYPLLLSQLDVLRAQMRSEESKAWKPADASMPRETGVKQVVDALKQVLARAAANGDEEDGS